MWPREQALASLLRAPLAQLVRALECLLPKGRAFAFFFLSLRKVQLTAVNNERRKSAVQCRCFEFVSFALSQKHRQRAHTGPSVCLNTHLECTLWQRKVGHE